MSNPNAVRGEELFKSKLAAAKVDPAQKALLTQLCAGFTGQVGVMATDAMYAASRLAEACIHAVRLCPDSTTEELRKHAVSRYQTTAVNLRTVQTEENMKASQVLATHLNEMSKDEVDHIDLIDSLDKATLSVEGARKRGLISSDFDTTSGDDAEFDQLEDPYSVARRVSVEGKQMFACPKCESVDIYTIMTDTFGCMKCGHENFRAILEDGDTLMDFLNP
jgi:ribosomal protein L37AE/L43A